MPEIKVPTLRDCIVAELGYIFLSLDASQIELRRIAHRSDDPQMLADLATGDLHLASAIRIAQLKGEGTGWVDDPERKDEKKKKRYDAKQVNFAVIYGAEAFKIAQMIEGTEEEAQLLLNYHRQAYPRLWTWIEEQITLAKEQGYVISTFGRIRPLPDLYSGIWKIREKAEREVVNTLIQGESVDIIKQAMIILRNLLDKHIRLVLNVHDEILWEVPMDLIDQAVEISKELEQYFPDYPFHIQKGVYYGEMEDIG